MPPFDTLTYAKKLQEAGVSPEQAEVHAWALREQVESNLATKQDLGELEARLMSRIAEVDARIDSLEARVNGRIDSLEARFDARFSGLEVRYDGRFRLLYWMLAFNLTLTTAILLKLLLS